MQLHKQTCRTIQTQKGWRKMKKPSSSSCGKVDVPRSRIGSYLEISHLANCPSHHANWSSPSSCNNTITDYLSIYLSSQGPYISTAPTVQYMYTQCDPGHCKGRTLVVSRDGLPSKFLTAKLWSYFKISPLSGSWSAVDGRTLLPWRLSLCVSNVLIKV